MTRPRLIALCFLFLFLAQALWMAARSPLAPEEAAAISASRSPVVRLATHADLQLAVRTLRDDPWLPRLPSVVFGLLLGGSLWYVAHRLYGNRGGYIALALYCFSPLSILAAARVGPEAPATWGLYGTVFYAIALSHTLDAPPRDRLLRALLFGLSLGLAAAALYPAALGLLPALAFLFYLAPQRRAAALAWAALSVAIAGGLFAVVHRWAGMDLLASLRITDFPALRPRVAAGGIPWPAVVPLLLASLPALLLFGLALITVLRSRRSRYFGNLAPLAVGLPLAVLGLATPFYLSVRNLVLALPFLCLFVAGVFADLLEEEFEGPPARLARAVLLPLLALNAAAGLWLLPRVS
ncbi:MAG TPA: glycosyltransferase family 39 protein [Terriglobales bacterium]|nr:glycosyltransferase family 39 protein [Terriglobales bacterium]